MDLCDDPNSPYITAVLEVPGMKVEQLSVRIENDQLIVEGSRTGPGLHTTALATPQRSANPAPSPSEPRAGAGGAAESAEDTALSALYRVQEIKYGKFRREIRLPPGMNVSGTLCECSVYGARN